MKGMVPSEDDLREHYKRMDDGELQDRATCGTLTELAQRLADAELEQRKKENKFRPPPTCETTNGFQSFKKNWWWFLLALIVLHKFVQTIIEKWR